MENTVLKIVYTFFVGIMLALFVGFGIDAFYPAPDYPASTIYDYSKEPTVEQQQKEIKAQQAYTEATELYNRNVSMMVTASAVIMLGLSLLLEKKNKVMTNGILLGGLFTLIYGVGRGFASGNSTTTFITIAVGLAVVVYLGYRRFSHRNEADAAPPAAPSAPTPSPPAAA